MKKYNYQITKSILLLVFIGFLNGCGSGGDTAGVTEIESNPDFIAKSKAIEFSRIQIYAGHIKDGKGQPRREINPSTIKSGDLITIDVEFEISGDFEEYALMAQLIPENIYNLLGEGETFSEIMNDDVTAQQNADFFDLGGVYFDKIKPGLMRGSILAKLPLLEKDTAFKIAIVPELDFLSNKKDISPKDTGFIPMHIDNRELLISKLEAVTVKIINIPKLVEDNEFTQLEIGGKFDENGYAIEPLFQTSVEIDLSTFNESEDIILSLSYVSPNGFDSPVGLLSSDINGNPVVNTAAQFTVNQASGLTSVNVPVVAYAPIKVQTALLKRATNIRNIANQAVENAAFKLEVSYIEDGQPVNTGNVYNLFIPLVSQSNSVAIRTDKEAVGYTVLRAGGSNSACLFVIPDIDTGLFGIGTDVDVQAGVCLENPNDESLWRYDSSAQNIISKIKDAEGGNYCITVIDKGIAVGGGVGSVFGDDVKLQECKKTGLIIGPPGPSKSTQILNLDVDGDGFKIKLNKGRFIDVDFTDSNNVIADLSPITFFSNNNGYEIDNNGRLFYAGKYKNNAWGDKSKVELSLSYGAEAYVDYMPIIGATTQGNTIIAATMFGNRLDLFNAEFAIKRYLPKKTSFMGQNSPGIKTQNGAKLDIAALGGYAGINLGEMIDNTVTATYNPANGTGDNTEDVLSGMTNINNIENDVFEYKLEAEFIEVKFIVGVVPVTLESGVEGNVNINIALTTPEIGIDVSVIETFELDAYVNAKVDAIVVSGGIAAVLKLIKQKLTLSANGGFNASGGVLPTQLSFNMGGSLVAELKAIQGVIEGVVEYKVPSFKPPFYKNKKKKVEIYSTDYLFNDDWTLFSEQPQATIIDF